MREKGRSSRDNRGGYSRITPNEELAPLLTKGNKRSSTISALRPLGKRGLSGQNLEGEE